LFAKWRSRAPTTRPTSGRLPNWFRLSKINYAFPKAKFNLILILCMCESNICTFLICMQFCIF
jgi:hypothetical protein